MQRKKTIKKTRLPIIEGGHALLKHPSVTEESKEVKTQRRRAFRTIDVDSSIICLFQSENSDVHPSTQYYFAASPVLKAKGVYPPSQISNRIETIVRHALKEMKLPELHALKISMQLPTSGQHAICLPLTWPIINAIRGKSNCDTQNTSEARCLLKDKLADELTNILKKLEKGEQIYPAIEFRGKTRKIKIKKVKVKKEKLKAKVFKRGLDDGLTPTPDAPAISPPPTVVTSPPVLAPVFEGSRPRRHVSTLDGLTPLPAVPTDTPPLPAVAHAFEGGRPGGAYAIPLFGRPLTGAPPIRFAASVLTNPIPHIPVMYARVDYVPYLPVTAETKKSPVIPMAVRGRRDDLSLILGAPVPATAPAASRTATSSPGLFAGKRNAPSPWTRIKDAKEPAHTCGKRQKL